MTYSVFPEEHALVLETPHAAALLPKIPDSFTLSPEHVGMPFTLDTCIRLAALAGPLGIAAPPSPIEHYYRWPRDRVLIPEPFESQIAMSAFFTVNPRGYCLSSIGVGKTLAAAWAADYLMECGAAQRFLIVSPLSSLQRTWADTFFYHFQHRTFAVLHGSAERRRRLLAQPADFYIVNYAGVGVLAKELADRPDITGVVLDEGAECGKKNTHLWKSLELLIYPAKGAPKPFVWDMTATPTPNSPEEAFPQCKLVTPTTVPKFFTQWKAMVMDHQSTYVWTPRAESTRIVYEAMRPAIRFNRDSLNLPGEIYSTRDVELSTEQKKHYKEIQRDLATEIKGGKVNAVNEGVKLSKLLQIACGCVYDVNGAPIEIDAGNRVETLMELIEQVGERVIVYVPFTAVTAMLARALNKHWNFVIVTGEVSKGERDRIFSDFQSAGADIDLIAHPGCMAHSLTLTEASTIIWYAPIDSNRIYEQANGRITRAGQKYTANIINLAGSAVERRMYKRLIERQKIQGALLEMVERGENLI